MKKKYYALLFLGIIVFAIGVFVIGAVFIEGFIGTFSPKYRFLGPSKIEMDLESEGIYSIYNEYESFYENKVYKSENEQIYNLELEIIDVVNGSSIHFDDLRSQDFKFRYSISGENNIEAQEEFRFILNEPTKIVIDTSMSDTEDFVLAVRKNDVIQSLNNLKSNAILLGISLVTGLILIIYSLTVIVKNRKSKDW